MQYIKYICLIIVVVFLNVQQAFSQATTLRYLKATYVYAGNNNDAGTDEYRFKFLVNGNYWGCYFVDGEPGWFYKDIYFSNNEYISDITTKYTGGYPYQIKVETWEQDCGGECTYDTGCAADDDDDHCSPGDDNIYLYWNEPGRNNTAVYNHCSYKVQYDFAYDIPKPKTPTITAPSGLICDPNISITYSTASFIESSYWWRGSFKWEYKVGNGSWQHLNYTSIVDNVQFTPTVNIRDLPGIKDITTNVDVSFRVITVYGASDWNTYYSSPSSESGIIQISPLAPVINSVTATPSCPDQNNTGIITVNVSSGIGNYRYILKTGQISSPENCDYNSGNCGNDPSGVVTGNTFEISNVAPGTYTLIVSNPGGTQGLCWTYKYVTVDSIPALGLNTPVVTNVSCNGGADGGVVLTSTGGKTPWSYSLSKSPYSDTNSTGVFSALQAGNYTATVTDGCSQIATSSLVISQPNDVQASVSINNPTCTAPVNGSVAATITKGEVNYSYKLLYDGQVVQELSNSSNTNWQADNIGSGTYTLEIKDADRLQCPGFSQSVTLNSPAQFPNLDTDLVVQNLTCFESGDGDIRLQQPDESGLFNYTLYNGNAVVSSTNTSEFTALNAGEYSMKINRNVGGCLDELNYAGPIILTQPEQIVIQLNKQDITCNGADDGKIVSQVTGSTSSDVYQWETETNSQWISLNTSTAFIENLIPGAYRLRITNPNCSAQSGEVTIVEPQVLTISSTNVKDIVCFGEQGEIEAIVGGGTSPYQYRYASSAEPIISSSQKTQLGAGIYHLKVVDVRGCEADYADALSITSPESKLALMYTVSDYNGYNVSCAGASDGYVQLQATGGGGDYQYAVDNSLYQSNPNVYLNAGLHHFSTKDRRGCIETTAIILTEPTSQLIPVLLDKKNVKCDGDENGVLSIAVSGGVVPYSYQISERAQDTGVFSNLKSGDYTIIISDNNGCTTTYKNSIEVLNAPILISMQKTDASCYHSTDGAINASVSGGAQPFHYEWLSGQSGLLLNNLPTGEYTLKVTDKEGCVKEETVTINQPDELAVTTNIVPVCIGKKGEVRLEANGGTLPFMYSINGGAYQDDPLFKDLSAGTFSVRTKDSHGCERLSEVIIPVRNDPVDANFIVATNRDALDTLVIREISVPKPEQVNWIFSPGIIVIDDDPWSPVIKIDDPGDYSIAMTGLFNGCEYTHSVTLTINPHDLAQEDPKMGVSGIKEMKATPNPSSGIFEVSVELHQSQRLVMRLIDILGNLRFQKKWEKVQNVSEQMDLSGSDLPSGLYVIQAITDYDARELRLIVNK